VLLHAPGRALAPVRDRRPGGHRVQRASLPEWPGGGSKELGFNFGGGVKLKLFKHALMRLDLRDSMTARPYGQLQFSQNSLPPGGLMQIWEASLGFSATF